MRGVAFHSTRRKVHSTRQKNHTHRLWGGCVQYMMGWDGEMVAWRGCPSDCLICALYLLNLCAHERGNRWMRRDGF